MSRSRPHAAAGLLVCAAWLLPACTPSATAPKPAPATPATASTSAPPSAPKPAGPRQATVLALDMSGSMEHNDPLAMRCAAARAFIGLSRPDEMVGLIGFSDDAGTAWAQPPVPTTPDGRKQLEAAVRCRPGGSTPTLAALQQAATWLGQAPGSGARSVVLLSDGVPTAANSAQIDQGQVDQIENVLVPQFRRKGWHISTIALGTGEPGTDIEFDFLQRIAHDTQGQFTDGSLGQPATAFNLLPAFVKVLKDEAGRSPGPDVEQSGSGPLEVGVPLSARSLDVVVLCRAPCARVALHLPTGAPASDPQPVSAGANGPQYGAIFSQGSPASGSWTVTVDGGGDVRVESLVELQLDIVLQPQGQTHPLGQPLAVTATVVTRGGTPYAGSELALEGSITHSPGGQPVPGGGFPLARVDGARYSGNVSVPVTEGPGAYDVTVVALPGPLASRSAGLAVGLFPRPVLAPTATATRWPVFGGIYSLPLLDRFGDLALQGPAKPEATVTGTLLGPDEKPYTRAALLSAEVAAPGAPAGTPAHVRAGGGRFRLSFPASRAGTYLVTIDSGGPESFGQTLPTTAPLRVAIAEPAPAQYARAWLVTAVLALALMAALGLLVLYGRFVSLRPPHGFLKAEGVRGRGTPLARRRRGRQGVADAFLRRNVSFRPDGIEFKFGYWSGIEVRRSPGRRTRWRRDGGGELSTDFRPVRRLRLGDQSHTVESPEDRADLTLGNAVRVVGRALGVPWVPGPRPRAKRPRR